MKNKIFGALIGATFMVVGALSFNVTNVHANEIENQEDAGEWIGVYNGGSTVQSCKCTSNWWTDECVVGDTTSDTSKCA